MRILKPLIAIIALASVVLSISGCGGSSNTAASAPTTRTKERLAQFFSATRGFQSGMSVGSFPGVSGVRKARLSRDGESGGGGDNGGIDLPPPTKYFDNWTELWVEMERNPEPGVIYQANYFEDEALTLPAGQQKISGTDSSYTIEFAITKGPKTGLSASGKSSYDPITYASNSTYIYKVPGEGIYSYDSDYTFDQTTANYGFTSNSRYDSEDRTYWMTTKASKSTNVDNYQTTNEDSNGYKSTFTWLMDGSGNATISGPDAGLPAQINWDSNGTGKIRWADGTTTSFTYWDFFNQWSGERKRRK